MGVFVDFRKVFYVEDTYEGGKDDEEGDQIDERDAQEAGLRRVTHVLPLDLIRELSCCGLGPGVADVSLLEKVVFVSINALA